MIDLCLAFIALLMVFPIFIVIIPILMLTGEREVFYLQPRIGQNDKLFGVIKFATMLKDSPKSGTVTIKNDSRILTAGRFLRNTKINELPQILNVIKGNMSIVGFRPLTHEGFQHYTDDVKEKILQMQPGLTGLGSIIFFNEEEILYNSKKDKMTCYIEDILPLKGALEKWYYENRSIFLDIKIILATALRILLKRSKFYINWFPIKSILKKSTLSAYF